MEFIWTLSRYILPVITVVILVKCIMTLMLGHPKEKIYGYIIDMNNGNRYPLNMWETSVGRSKSCDVVLPYDTVARSHAVITRRIDGWYVHDLLTKAVLKVNGHKVELKALIKDGDILDFGKNRFRFEVVDDPVQNVGRKTKRGKNTPQNSAPQRKGTASAQHRYQNDVELRKRTGSTAAQNRTGAYFYDETNKPTLNFEKKQAVNPPSYKSAANSFTVETASRSHPARKTKKQPRIVNKDTGEVFILCGNEVSIGSARKSDIRLHASGVEKLHSLLVLYEDGWAIDRENGKAYLNGQEIKSPQLLFDGDIIAVGDERLYYHD